MRRVSELAMIAAVMATPLACSSSDVAGDGGAGTNRGGDSSTQPPGASGSGSGTGAGGSGSEDSGAGRGGSSGDPMSGTGGSSMGGSMGDAGQGFPTDLEGTCKSDADCELCTAPVSAHEPCCPGCPISSSHEICAQLQAAFAACGPTPALCPAVSCIDPGSPKCSPEGICVMTEGIEQ